MLFILQPIKRRLNQIYINNPGLWVWGQNSFGMLGDGTITNKSSPVQTITGGTNWAQVSGGTRNSAAIKTDGTLWLWGDGAYGQLGNGNSIGISSPVQTTAGGTTWKQVSCGQSDTLAIQ